MKNHLSSGAVLLEQEISRAAQNLLLARFTMARILLKAGFQPFTVPAWLGLFETKPVLAARLAESWLETSLLHRLRDHLPRFICARAEFRELQCQATPFIPVLSLN